MFGSFFEHLLNLIILGVYAIEKTEALYAQLNERAEAATMYTLQYIYSVPVTKNH